MNFPGVQFFPDNYFSLTDYNEVLAMISKLCKSQTGKDKAFKPIFCRNAEEIEQIHNPLKEAIYLLQSGNILPQSEFTDNRKEIANLRTRGYIIEPEQLQHIKIMLQAFDKLVQFLSGHKSVVYLTEIVESVIYHRHLLSSIEKITDNEGNIREDASEELQRLHKEYKKQATEIEKRLLSIFRELKFSGLTSEDSNMTIRNGRTVIPVPATFKYKVKGIIHDESATGQTTYIEPLEIVEMGNKLREIHAAQQREILRILKEISAELHIYAEDLFEYYEILGETDLYFAKARFAEKYKAVIPAVINEPFIEWKQARNIVLQQYLEKNGKKIIPLEISLGHEINMLVLSGANAGGKSVVIKTVALLQTMVQSGLPVPFDAQSKAGVFNSVLLNIGDGQSIESDLSTFSSHLETMKVFLQSARSACLYLIDEIGTGTDPILGGALAQAILLELHKKDAKGIVTTHLDVLKKMADETQGAGNAAMVFDTEKLQPSYVLRTGIPGNSFTFEIAARTGIPEKIIEEAKKYAGNERITFEQKISDVEKKTLQLEESLQRQKMAEDFLSDMISKYSGLVENIEKKQTEIVEKTKQEASEIIGKANKTIENTIRQIRESSADKAITQKAREQVKETEKEISAFSPSPAIPEKLKKHVPPVKEQTVQTEIKAGFKEGMKVRHSINGMEGVVLGLMADNRIKVAFHSVSLTLPAELLIPSENSNTGKALKKIQVRTDFGDKAQLFSRQLDIRGMKAEEVMYKLEKHIDDALLIGVYDFSVLHGKGYGVLRNVTRQLLSKHPNVESFESEHIEFGGDGITIVRLKR